MSHAMTGFVCKPWDNRNEAERCVNTSRPLTNSLERSKERLSVKSIFEKSKKAAHPEWWGRPAQYQRKAQEQYLLEHEHLVFSPWAWVSTTCTAPMCMNVGCMVLHKSIRIAYPKGLCVYCGEPSGTIDHLLPRAWTGEASRSAVAVVPACAHCNSTANDSFEFNIHKRRKLIHDRIRKRNRTLLESPDRSAAEIDQLGHLLRSSAIEHRARKDRLRRRLLWPEDPDFDRRAFEKSGIENAEGLGLI